MRPALTAGALLATLLLSSCDSLPTSPWLTCVDMVPLSGHYDSRAPGYIVFYHEGTDAVAATARLERRHGFKATHVWPYLEGFAADFSPRVRDRVRCERVVKSVSHNGISHPY